MDHSEDVELRFYVGREMADVLDAVSLARRIHRNELLVSVVKEYVAQVTHEATVIQRITRGNGTATEREGKGS